MASQNYVLQEVKGIKESFDNGTKLAIMAFADLDTFRVESTDEFTEIFTSTESLGGTQQLAENETPPINNLEDGFSVNLSDDRFGNGIEVTTTDMRKFRDSTTKVNTYLIRQRNKLMTDVRNKFVTDIHGPYNDGFVGADFTAPDGVALYGVHSWNTVGAATWDNSATAALSEAAVQAAEEFGGAFLDASGKPMPQSYDTIFVKRGGSASVQAKKIFANAITPTTIGDVNIYEGAYTIIESPYITSSTAWFMQDTKQEESPVYGGIGQFPTMSDPIVQNNGAIRTNVEGFWKIGIINLPYNLYGSTGV